MKLRNLAVVTLALLTAGFGELGREFGMTGTRNAAVVVSCTPGTAATNFLARTSGLSGTETRAYCNLINGLVTDSIITGTLSGAAGCGSVLDLLYILATNNKTTAYLNLCGTSFPLTEIATVNCVADLGCTSDGTTGRLNTSWTPGTNAVNYTLNSAAFGTYVQTARAVNSTTSTGAASTIPSSDFTLLQQFESGSLAQYDVNDASFPTTASPGSRGVWVVSRTASNAIALYRNGSATALATAASVSTSMTTNAAVAICALNNAGTITFSTDQVSAVFYGKGLTATQAANIMARLNTFMAAFGNNVY